MVQIIFFIKVHFSLIILFLGYGENKSGQMLREIKDVFP